jgi:hypothetical protein
VTAARGLILWHTRDGWNKTGTAMRGERRGGGQGACDGGRLEENRFLGMSVDFYGDAQ